MEELKEQIMDAAMEQFKKVGIRNVSIDSVCAELRISKKTFYQYFESKELLVRDVITREHAVNFEKYNKISKDKNAIEVFILSIREIRKSHEKNDLLYILWYDIKKYYPNIYQEFDCRKAEIIKQVFEANLRQGIAEGFYRSDMDVDMVTHFHAVFMKYAFSEMLQSDKKFNMKQVVDFFIDLMAHYIVNEKGMIFLKENVYQSK